MREFCKSGSVGAPSLVTARGYPAAGRRSPEVHRVSRFSLARSIQTSSLCSRKFANRVPGISAQRSSAKIPAISICVNESRELRR